jgi:Sec-independent protein translocase protein TatA
MQLHPPSHFDMNSIMKRTAFILLFGLAVPSLALAEQKTNDPLSDAMQLLRKAMRDFEKNPNAASEARSNIAASAKAAAATAKTEAAADAARAPLSPQAAPALAASAAAPSASVPERSFAEMEQMYLDGRITAKEFQKYLQNIRLKPLKTEPAPPATTNVAAAAPVTNAPVLPTVGTAPDAMTDVERKLDELIRAQEAREKAATNQAPATTGPKTKRQRLDDLLKQLVEGKISDEDYKSQRAKIMAEPD